MRPRSVLDLLKRTASEVTDDDVLTLSAAIAYYTVFSLPPLLVIIVAVAGAVFGADAVREAITGQVGGLAGGQAATEIETMIQNASTPGEGIGGKIAGLAALLFGATGAFAQLQAALNRAFEVDPKKEQGGIVGTLLKRVLSFGMVLTIAFLLLVSLVLSAVLGAVGSAAESLVPGGFVRFLLHLANLAVSFGVTTVLFAALFVVLPDKKVAWRNVWVGAAATALLFTVGKSLIGLYIGTADPGSAFGAAGSLALILVWIYYSALIILVGAEFTQVWAERHGEHFGPEHEVHPYAQPRKPQPY